MAMQRRLLCVLLAGTLLTGCNDSPEQAPGTGAKECAQAYYEALTLHDWSKAYATLDPESRDRCGQQRFNGLAERYLNGLGFELDAVHVRACEERGTKATAHVVLTGRAGADKHRYKDAITLHLGDDGWRVVLPSNFGQGKTR
jgi:hypothetical protein